MINLILNEFKKIFSKKSTYIIFIVIIILMTGITILNKYAFKIYEDDFEFYQENKSYLEKELKNIEKSNFTDEYHSEEWIFLKQSLEEVRIVELLNKNGDDAWKASIIGRGHDLFPSQYEVLNYQLNSKKNKNNEILESKEYKEILKNYNEEIDRFVNFTEEDYTEYQLNDKLKALEEILAKKDSINENKNNIDYNLSDIERDIAYYNTEIEILELRKEKNIPYASDNYMNRTLMEYEHLKSYLAFTEEPTEKDNIWEKRQYYSSIKDLKENEFILENEMNIKDPSTGKYQIMNMLASNIFFYIVIIVVLAGNIVAEEYANGTIKNLLTKPFTRSKILTSKLLTIIIFTFIALLILLVAQTLVTGIIFDFKTMIEPAVEYNISLEKIEKTNLMVYILKDYLFTLPFILVFLLTAFSISILTTSATASVTIGILSFLGTEIVNQLLVFSNANWVRYIPTLNWDWKEFLGAEYHSSYGINVFASITLTILTYIVLLIPAYIIFNKKDIKNI